MSTRLTALLTALSLVTLSACSSSTDAGVGAAPAAFAKYCTGTLKLDKKLMKAAGSGAWITDGSMATAGSTFLVSPDFSRWAGYAFRADGSPMKIDGDFSKGLVKDTDFTSDCALDPSASDKRHTVLFAKATIFPNKDLTGTPCTLEAGTVLTNYSFSGGFSGPATVSSLEIKSKCSIDTGYSTDMQYGYVLDK